MPDTLLGVVIYHMVTGRLPFSSESRRASESKGMGLPSVPPSQYAPDLVPRWDAAIMRCLEIAPDKRFRNAKEASAALAGEVSRTKMPTRAIRTPFWRDHRLLLQIAGALALVMTLVILVLLNSPKLGLQKQEAKAERHLAVLPFTVIAKDTETQAFADGLAETVAANISQLTSGHSLRIIPILELRSQRVTTAERAREEFGADLVVTGSLHSSGNLVRATVVMIDTQTRRQVGGNTVDFARSDPFALEDRVAATVLAMLEIRPTNVEQGWLLSHGTVYPQAYDNYLRARGYLQDYEKSESVESALEMLNNALRLDPNYGSAYAAQGAAYWYKFEMLHDKSWVQKAREACEHSVKLQPSLAAAHACLGNVFTGTGEPGKAIEEFTLAKELEPSDAAIYRGLAGAYEVQRRMEDAENTYRQSIRLMPQYWSWYSHLGAFYYRQARYQEAAAMFQKVIELAPDNQRGYCNLAGIYVTQGRYGDAVPLLRRAATIHPDGDVYTNLANAYFKIASVYGGSALLRSWSETQRT